MKTARAGIASRVEVLYVVMLALHVAHVTEEALGGFRVEVVLGLSWFLLVNAALFAVPLMGLALLLKGSVWGKRLAILYAVVMTANGILHNAGWAITGRYANGFAGAYTGIALVVVGPLLLRELLRSTAPHRQC